MFDGVLKGKFYQKCKLAVRMTKARLDMIMKKRIAMKKFLKNDIGDLLKNDLHKNAYDRAEGYLGEHNMTSCYEFVDKFCLQISDNLSNMSKQNECPEDCKEAVSSLIYAAARFADLPELRELRKLFAERYGTSLDSYVNKEFENKLKMVHPTKDMKLQLMQNIAKELGVQFDHSVAEEKVLNHPPKDFKQDNDILEKPFRPPPNKKSNVDDISNNDEGHGVAGRKSRPAPGSVRRNRSKIEYNEDDVGASNSNHNKPDEEERMLDKMLIRHSLKKSTLWEMESDKKSGQTRHGKSKVGTKKPPPDYDDLVARITAFKEDI